jgi:hypothetical protein
MEAAKGINPEITPEEIMLTTEVKEEVKEVPPKLRQNLHTWKPRGSVPAPSFSRPPSYKGAPQFYSMKQATKGRGVVAFAFLSCFMW